MGEEPNLTTAEKDWSSIKHSILSACMYCRPMWGSGDRGRVERHVPVVRRGGIVRIQHIEVKEGGTGDREILIYK